MCVLCISLIAVIKHMKIKSSKKQGLFWLTVWECVPSWHRSGTNNPRKLDILHPQSGNSGDVVLRTVSPFYSAQNLNPCKHHAHLGWVFSPHLIQSRHSLIGTPRGWLPRWLWMLLNWQSIVAITVGFQTYHCTSLGLACFISSFFLKLHLGKSGQCGFAIGTTSVQEGQSLFS